MKKALITGITGQDGRYLVEYLIGLGYEVWGMVRRSSDSRSIQEIKKISEHINLRYGDMTDAISLRSIIKESMPDLIFNLAAQSHVRISFDIPEYTAQVNGVGVIHLLDVVKEISPGSRVYHASTSELFGSSPPPQNESTPLCPRSPYGIAKLQAYWEIINYRESYNLFSCQGMLFNHESPHRGENFVTRKITKAVARYVTKKQKVLYLGNLDSKRDWGFAGDYVKAMYKIINHVVPDNFVIATGETHTIREFLEQSFKFAGINVISDGKKGLDECYVDSKTGEVVVSIDPRLYRPTEVDVLCGDYTKAKTLLGWKPEVTFHQLVEMMVKADIDKESA